MNKFVFLLPISVMFLLFYFGYSYINNSEQVTNESLQNDINISLEANRVEEGVKLTGKWDWTQMPIDGISGNDYIMLSVKNEGGETISPESFTSAKLFLQKGNQKLKEAIAEIVEDGVVFTFPNKIIDHESYGNRGEFEVILLLEEEKHTATVTYVHTWVDHELVRFNRLHSLETGIQDMLMNKYWSVLRSIQF